jgi:protocatechuate 3,4-dioxygenase, beta subunit
MSLGARFRPDAAGTQPDYDVPAYRSSHRRRPLQPLLEAPQALSETPGPRFPRDRFPPTEDLSVLEGKPALGERIIVAGTISDEAGRPVPDAMVEIWQANASGRYQHPDDRHDAPLDPNFRGAGRVFTDGAGRYRFVTVKPGAYPWRNHPNAWRPNHIHFSFFGHGFAARLITQMYFPGDPLLALDPVFNAVPDTAARDRLIAAFDIAATVPEWALGYRFDVVLRGGSATPLETA